MNKAYIASGFFNEGQLKDIETIITACLSTGWKYFSPKDENLADPKDNKGTLQRIFDKNVEEIEECDILICNTRDKDIGSIFEAGVAYKIGKPIIYFNSQLKGGIFNLMLAKSGRFLTNDLITLIKALDKLTDNINSSEDYEGDIE